MKKNEISTDTAAIIMIIALFFSFLILTGTLTSGFHFVDDHEVILIKNQLKSSPLTEVMASWVRNDLNSTARFRPFYFVHRVIETKIFGSDFLLWSIYTAILCAIAMGAFFAAIRRLSFGLKESVLFLLITFIGPQSPVFWRLGPQESLGMAMLGLAFYFMSKSLGKGIFNINNLLFIIFLILSSLTKESFVVIIPAFLFFKIYYESRLFHYSLRESFRKSIILIIPIIVLIAELIIIEGLMQAVNPYAGGNVMDFVKNIPLGFLHLAGTFYGITILLLIISGYGIWLGTWNYRKMDWFPFVFFLLIAIPNIVLYKSSGLVERYLLPTSMGLAFFVVSVLNSPEWRMSLFKKSISILLFVSILPFVIKSWSEAREFTKDGHETSRLLSSVSEADPGRLPALVVVDPVASYELSVSLKTWLNCEKQIDLFGYPYVNRESKLNNQEYIEGWKSYFTDKLLTDIKSDPQVIIFLNNKLADDFFRISGLKKDAYTVIDVGEGPFGLFRSKITK